MLQTIENEAYTRLQRSGLKPSVQRIAIMEYLLTHFTHPTIDEVYQALCPKIPTLSKTTVYNTLKLFSDHHAAQMITIDNHRVCYDGNIAPHVHFYCKECARVIDMFDEEALILSRSVISTATLSMRCNCIIRVYVPTASVRNHNLLKGF